jgi:hypothetical protein
MWLSQEITLIKSNTCEVSMSKERQGGQERHSQSKPNQPEQSPRGGGINKPELHQPKEMPLAPESNLPSQEQQLDDLDPKIKERIRQYCMAGGDAEEEARLLEQVKTDPILRGFFLRPGGGGLAYGPHPPLDYDPEED